MQALGTKGFGDSLNDVLDMTQDRGITLWSVVRPLYPSPAISKRNEETVAWRTGRPFNTSPRSDRATGFKQNNIATSLTIYCWLARRMQDIDR